MFSFESNPEYDRMFSWIRNMFLDKSDDDIKAALRYSNYNQEMTIQLLQSFSPSFTTIFKLSHVLDYIKQRYIFGLIGGILDPPPSDFDYFIKNYQQDMFTNLSTLAFSRIKYIPKVLQFFVEFNFDFSRLQPRNAFDSSMIELCIDYTNDRNIRIYNRLFKYFKGIKLEEIIKSLLDDNIQSYMQLRESVETSKITYLNVHDSKYYSISFLQLIIIFEASTIFNFYINQNKDYFGASDIALAKLSPNMVIRNEATKKSKFYVTKKSISTIGFNFLFENNIIQTLNYEKKNNHRIYLRKI